MSVTATRTVAATADQQPIDDPALRREQQALGLTEHPPLTPEGQARDGGGHDDERRHGHGENGPPQRAGEHGRRHWRSTGKPLACQSGKPAVTR